MFHKTSILNGQEFSISHKKVSIFHRLAQFVTIKLSTAIIMLLVRKKELLTVEDILREAVFGNGVAPVGVTYITLQQFLNGGLVTSLSIAQD